MIEAYEIGISLALQDGVSVGIDFIRRKLASLDQAILATSNNLARLQQGAGTGLPRSPAPQTVERPAPLTDTAEPAIETRGATLHPPPLQPEPDRPTLMASSLKASSTAPTNPEMPPPVKVATAPQPPITPSSSAPDRQVNPHHPEAPAPIAAPPVPSTPAPPRQPAVPATERAPVTIPPPPIQTPAAPPQKQAATMPAPALQRGPLSSPAMGTEANRTQIPVGTATVIHHHKHSSRREFVTRQTLQTVPNPPAKIQDLLTPASPAHSAPRIAPDHTPAFEYPGPKTAGGQRVSRTPEPVAMPNVPPAPPARPPTAAAPALQPPSFAPPPLSQPTIMLQGDIILDGARLGRWMTSSLARQAARPPAGPTGPDPRQTPLWSGQAQGF
jgi:hypothetical protein